MLGGSILPTALKNISAFEGGKREIPASARNKRRQWWSSLRVELTLRYANETHGTGNPYHHSLFALRLCQEAFLRVLWGVSLVREEWLKGLTCAKVCKSG